MNKRTCLLKEGNGEIEISVNDIIFSLKRKWLNILIVTVIAIIAGALIAFIFDFINGNVKIPETILLFTFIGSFAAVAVNILITVMNPIVIDRESLKRISKTPFVTDIPIKKQNHENLLNAYEEIAAKTTLLLPEASPGILLITSPKELDAKEIFSIEFAKAIHSQGNKVLLINCNFREKSSLYTIKPLVKKGISDASDGNVPFSEISDIHYVSAGEKSVDPYKETNRLIKNGIIKNIGRDYDNVIVIAPGILNSSEAALLAGEIKNVIFLTEKYKTMVKESIEAIEVLEIAGVEFMGSAIIS